MINSLFPEKVIFPEFTFTLLQNINSQHYLVPALLILLFLITALLFVLVKIRAKEKKKYLDFLERYLLEMKKSSISLKEGEKRCQKIIDHLSEGLILINESGIILFANSMACIIIGLPFEKVIHQPLPSFLNPLSTDHAGIIRKLKKGSHISDKVQTKRDNKTHWIYLKWNWHPTPENEPGAALVLKDITEKIVTEEKIQELIVENNEKSKQINCLFDISDISGVPNITLEGIIERSLQIIPNGLKFSHDAWVEIVFEDQLFTSPNFKETPWSYIAPIKIRRKKLGHLRVGYTQEKPRSIRDAFHLNEKLLIKNIAEKLGQVIELINLENRLKDLSEKDKQYTGRKKDI